MKDTLKDIMQRHNDEWQRFLLGSIDELVPGSSPLMDDLVAHFGPGVSPDKILSRLEKFVR